jgi:hypothetical protein
MVYATRHWLGAGPVSSARPTYADEDSLRVMRGVLMAVALSVALFWLPLLVAISRYVR